MRLEYRRISKGYHYLRDAIMMSVEDMEMLNSDHKILYPTISEASSDDAEPCGARDRHAIEVAWSRGKMDTIDEMLKEGLLEEVQKLKDMGYHRGMVSMQGLGYKEILAYLDGEYPLEEAVRIPERDTRHLQTPADLVSSGRRIPSG